MPDNVSVLTAAIRALIIAAIDPDPRVAINRRPSSWESPEVAHVLIHTPTTVPNLSGDDTTLERSTGVLVDVFEPGDTVGLTTLASQVEAALEGVALPATTGSGAPVTFAGRRGRVESSTRVPEPEGSLLHTAMTVRYAHPA